MKKRIIALFLVSILIMSLIVGCSTQSSEEENITKEEEYIPVEIEKAQHKNISNVTTLSGRIYADKDVMILPKVPGKVTSLNVQIGDKVNKGKVLFTLEKKDIQKQVDQAKIALDAAKTNYELSKEQIDNAKVNFERTKELYEQGAISQAQFEQAKLGASDKSLEALQISVNQAQLAYDQAVEALNNASVTAPIGGTISSVNIDVGEMASNAQPAITIVDMDNVYVQINITENLISGIQQNQEVTVVIPSAKEEEFTGKIDSISPVSDPRTQLYPIKIYIPNTEHTIKPGMLAQVSLSTDTRENVVAVKSEAVVERNGESFIYIVEDNKAVEKKVKIGLDTGDYVEIIEGVKEGDNIIVKGQSYVKDETQVKVVRGE